MNYKWITKLPKNCEALFTLTSPDRIAICAAPIADHTDVLHDEEIAILKKAVNKRKIQFSTGRMLSRRCFELLNLPPAPVLQGINREPVWPEGIKGSISHTDSFCVSAVTENINILSLGIDIEKADGVTPELWGHIFTAAERRYIEKSEQPLQTASLFFSAKESFYKMQYPLTSEMLDFKDVSVKISNGLFEMQTADGINLPYKTGGYAVLGDHVFTIICAVNNG